MPKRRTTVLAYSFTCVQVHQAADGNASAAKSFIRDFAHLAKPIPREKWRALLDGMLFEVYFNSDGNLRSKFKNRHLDNLFVLQNHETLRESFEFIANCLR